MSEETSESGLLAATDEPASGETADRYVIEIEPERVKIIDTQIGETVRVFVGPERLADALACVIKINEQETRAGLAIEALRTDVVQEIRAEEAALAEERRGFTLPAPITPREFLVDVLPTYAQRQRLEGLLSEAEDVERAAARLVASDTWILNRATGLRRRLAAHLAALSATESAEKASAVGQDTPWSSPDAEPLADVQDFVRRNTPTSALSKPGPY